LENVMERSADGRDVVNVERGENLGQCADPIRKRWGNPASSLRVELVKFVSDHEAAVWTTALHDGQPIGGPLTNRQARVLLVDGQWKQRREDVSAKFAIAGTPYPPIVGAS
jgi:hypothetical protein